MTRQPPIARVLVVDDDPFVRAITQRALHRLGYDAIVAEGGHEAIAIVREDGERLSLVILDLSMPDLSGEETLARIHEIAPRLPVIVNSGEDDARLEGALRESGATAFLHKPFDFEEFARTLAEMMG